VRRGGPAALAVALALPSVASAQAWTPGTGEGALAITAGDYAFAGHFDSDGGRDPFGGTHARSIAVEIQYGITDRLAVTAGLPFISTRLTGSFPIGVALGPLDDGRYHGDFQDVRLELRFMATARTLALTPFVAANLPSHQYEVVGEAVPGKRTRELILGTNLGRLLGRRAYVHGRYGYSIVEKVVPEVRTLNRSNLELEAGGSALRRLALRVLVAWQVTHGGLDLEDMRTHPGFFRTHDRAARTNYFNLGAGATLEAARSLDLYLVFVKTVSGENAHQARSWSLGASWQFGGAFGRSSPTRIEDAAAAP
jgi:hypothetical protein